MATKTNFRRRAQQRKLTRPGHVASRVLTQWQRKGLAEPRNRTLEQVTFKFRGG